ncbi:MAG: hypothetical protein HC905_03200 [Bacteroidales bacterium]|nr:hypothetical protein [Bacteroidales bacterium]
MVNKLAYFLLISISKILSIFPFFVAHGIADLLSFLAYHLIRYRRKVVRINLERSFPESRQKKIISIEKRFYRFFADYFMETLMSRFISERRLSRHFTYRNTDLINSYLEKKRSVILVTAHLGNFEMSMQMPRFIKHKIMAVYKPQSNKAFNKFFVDLRERFGIQAVPMNSIGKKFTRMFPTIFHL